MPRHRTIVLSRRVEEVEHVLTTARQEFQRALEAQRDACGHVRVVEVELPRPLRDGHKDDSGRIRFCLGCGEKEHGRQFGGRHGLKASYLFDRLKAEPKAILPESALETLLDRLHAKARFDEFDANGAWRLADPDYDGGTD